MTDQLQALQWVVSKNGDQPPMEFLCPTRDVADGRLPKLYSEAIHHNFNTNKAALLTALAGELTANCFDHNLGKWRDISGCWFSFSSLEDQLHITIADRGQGILNSLKQADSSLASPHDALVVALTKQISGRQPENRGRGLKFIINALNEHFTGAKFILRSDDAQVVATAPIETSRIVESIQSNQAAVYGTYAEIVIPPETK